MKEQVKSFAALFAVQMLLYVVFILNYRSIVQARVVWAASTDVLIASINFFIIRRIAKAQDLYASFLGYLFGSAAGTILGIVLSQWLGV